MSELCAKHQGKAKIVPKRNTMLLPYQGRWVKDDSRLKLVEKSRQIGFSWATAYRLVSTTSLVGARYDDWVSSRDEIQARLFLDDCKGWAKVLSIAAQDLGERVIDEQRNTAQVLRYANGRATNSMSSNPDAQAGKRGSRVADEFALNPDPRKLYSIAYPGITWGGNFEIISTHRGTANYFNELINEIKHKGNPKGFSLHTVTLQDALNDGFLSKLQGKLPPEDKRQQMDETDYFNFIRAGCVDEESFLQEYMCIPADDNSAFLSYDLIAGCEYRPTEEWEYTVAKIAAMAKGQIYIGVDIGRLHDLTVIWVMEKLGDVFYTRAVICMKAETFDAQEHCLYEWLRCPAVRRCCIDQTGIGRQFAERAQQRFGKHRVEPVNFSGVVKEELAYPVKAAFEDRALRIPNEDLIRSDLRAIKKETTASGNIRFTADRGKNGHADRFWALALAIHAGKKPQLNPRATVIM